jgi:hypothetical protein
MKRPRALPYLLVLLLAFGCSLSRAQTSAGPRFEISFPATAHAGPVTGRVFVVISRHEQPEPRLQVGSWTQEAPFFGTDVFQLAPGAVAIIDGETPGYPLSGLKQVPPGDYYVQALLNVYTEFHRADGHVLWAHLDQWEGQQFNLAPGNLYSEMKKVHLDPAGCICKLTLARVIPPVEMPPDTRWVKHIKIVSKLLSQFWGRPIYLGATVLLPKDYDEHGQVRYPAIYEQGHFTLDPPLGFASEPPGESSRPRPGYELFRRWIGPGFPRIIAVTFQHPTPFFDDSYAVNSANDGPYGDAIMQELIPYIEEHFRIIREPWARVLTGGSTGGWESLALQFQHPDFFGGTWTFYPDPIDFRRVLLVDIYDDDNAFVAPGFEWVEHERPLMRTAEGQVIETVRQMSQFEAVLGSHGRSGQQLEAWEAVYSPVGADGYPQPLWDKQSGKIDHDVAGYMREHGYDLRDYLERNWKRVGPQLAGKIHIYCGDMDNYYLNLAVYLMQNFLEGVREPAARATFAYGRPMKGHGWAPFSQVQLVRAMVDYIDQHAPAGADIRSWKY